MASDFNEDVVTGESTVPGHDPLLGTIIDGRFHVVALIGTGGMGRVYRAVQSPLNRAVALKVLDYNYGAGRDAAFRQRFLVEAALTAKLSHPNTITVIDYGCTPQGIFWLAMEYLDGHTLDQVMAAQGALHWRQVLAIGQQIARSLKEAHNLGVVHRDLKPANVMLLSADDDADVVKVLDFGLVKSFIEGQELEGRAITQQGMLMGSPPYMAPEQGEHNNADPRSDIYSLGTVLYEALTGKPPFTGNNTMQVILDHVNKPVPPIRVPAGRDQPPPQMTGIVMKCLAKSPMDRFQSMEDVLAAMQELAQPERFATPPPNTLPKAADELETAMAPVVAPPKSGLGRVLGVLAFVAAAAAGSLVTGLMLKRGPTAAPLPVTTPVPAPVAVVKPAPPPVVVAPPEPEPEVVPLPEPKTVTFHLLSDPSGALVTMGGVRMGRTPLDVPVTAGADGAGAAEFTLSLSGFQPLTFSANGSGAEPVTVEKTLLAEPLPEPPKKKLVAEKKAKAPAVKSKSAARLDDDDEPVAAPVPADEGLKKPQ